MPIVKKILVISDTHGQLWNVDQLHKVVEKPDYIIHLGDVDADQDYVEAVFHCPVDMVHGNHDLFSRLPGEYTFREGKHIIFATHGHGYSVYNGTDRIIKRAKALGADTVLFGHTHRPLVDWRDGVRVVNPGSLSLPRQETQIPTYVWMTVDSEGEIAYEVRELPE